MEKKKATVSIRECGKCVVECPASVIRLEAAE